MHHASTLAVVGPNHFLTRTRMALLLTVAAAASGVRVLLAETEPGLQGLGMILPRGLVAGHDDVYAVEGFAQLDLRILLPAGRADALSLHASTERDLIIYNCGDDEYIPQMLDRKLLVAGYEGMMRSESIAWAQRHPDAVVIAATTQADQATSPTFLHKAYAEFPQLAQAPCLPLASCRTSFLPQHDAHATLLANAVHLLAQLGVKQAHELNPQAHWGSEIHRAAPHIDMQRAGTDLDKIELFAQLAALGSA